MASARTRITATFSISMVVLVILIGAIAWVSWRDGVVKYVAAAAEARMNVIAEVVADRDEFGKVARDTLFRPGVFRRGGARYVIPLSGDQRRTLDFVPDYVTVYDSVFKIYKSA